MIVASRPPDHPDGAGGPGDLGNATDLANWLAIADLKPPWPSTGPRRLSGRRR